MTRTKEQFPDLKERIERNKQGERFCGICHEWVPAAEWNRQYRMSAGVCWSCIVADDLKERRVAPEARFDLKPVPIPPKIGALWKFLEEMKGDEE